MSSTRSRSQAARSLRPEIDIYGVQSERYPAATQSFHGQPISGGGSSLAEGIAVGVPGVLTSSLIREWVRDMLIVSEVRQSSLSKCAF